VFEKEKYINVIRQLNAEIKDLKQHLSDKPVSEYTLIKDYEKLYDELNTLVYLTDPKTNVILYANKETKKIFGEIEGKKCWEAFQGSDRACEDCEFFLNKDNFGKKIKNLNRESYYSVSENWYLLHETAVNFYTDSIKKLTIAFDIQKQKKMQKENLERTHNLRLILHNVNQPIFVVQNQKFKFINKATEHFFKLGSKKLLNQSVEPFFVFPFKEKLKEACENILSNKKNIQKEYIIKILDGNGDIKEVKLKTESVKWENEQSVLVVLQDITDDRKIRKELIESEKFYKILFEYSPMPVIIYKKDKIVLFNNAFKKYIEDSELTLLQNIFVPDMLHPDSRSEVENAVKKIKEGKSFVSVDNIKVYDFRKKIFNISIVISSILYRSEPALIIIVNDITDRIKAEEELKKTISVKDKFFSIIAHDLRNPFNQILGFAELINEDITKNEIGRLKRLSEYIYMSAETGQKLLENLLSWAKSQTGSLAFNPENVNLFEVINDVKEFYYTTAEKKNIFINIRDVGIYDCVFFDKEMLKTILRNLISNALKYTNKGGLIEILTFEKKDSVQINISDNGTGITEKQLDKIFKMNASFTMPGTENEKGTGLGLLVCKEFIEKNHGKIFVESEKGKGSTFSFTAKKCI